MSLDRSLIKEFVEITENNKPSTDGSVYGTIVEFDDQPYVQVDGSSAVTPVETVVDVSVGDRVMVTIKDHKAIIVGNVTSKAVGNNELVQKVDTIVAESAVIGSLFVKQAVFDDLHADVASFKDLTVDNFTAINGVFKELSADVGEFKDLTADNFTAINGVFDNLSADFASFKDLTTDDFTAIRATIENLNSKYVNIDYANIDKAWIAELYAKSGIIQDMTMENNTITGYLHGVTIRGDLIEGNTIVADKLILRGETGLYYRLNTTGVTDNTVEDYDVYIKTDNVVPAYPAYEMVEDAYTLTNEQVCYSEGLDMTNHNGYFCISDNGYWYEVTYEYGYVKTGDTVGTYPRYDIIEHTYTLTNEQVCYCEDLEGLGHSGYFCIDNDGRWHDLVYDGAYKKTNNIVSTFVAMADLYTTSNEQVYYSKDLESQGYSGYFCIGDDGYWYEANYSSIPIKIEQTEYNSLNGTVILAQSVTADKIQVSDLKAFDATIGGFNITYGGIYSGVKSSIDNTTEGVFLGSDGEIYVGDSNQYFKYYKGYVTTENVILTNPGGTLVEGIVTDSGDPVYVVENPDNSKEYYTEVSNVYYEVKLVGKLDISADRILFGADADLKTLMTENVKIGYYTDPDTGNIQPSVELAEGDSPFKQLITNTKTIFSEDDVDGTTIDNESVKTNVLIVNDEIRHGQYTWVSRSNGHYTLMWGGVTE